MTALFFRLPQINALWATILIAFTTNAQAETPRVSVSAFSGKPVPRFESLRYPAVHGRQGPTLDHPILWRYEQAGLPVLILRETRGWARIRDKDGDEVWVQSRMLSSDETVVLTQSATLRKRPDEDAVPIATLKAGLIADLQTCALAWCEVRIERRSGWVEKRVLWGVETATDGVSSKL